ncbi:MAG: prolyl oligopeptidase family serine peptidase [Propionicimonas sp.]|uniref:prolyl oligopeptidase family serine peptidase n=1 Tax=Propionicimonas sp. TaxID=1955623 RepID=UPI002B1F3672|nr:prolyl oligopeptidase family serine peptidase [Propionicimonas sp.]MEA4943343.1 prolyl oligopeptidase family serine peptidase [Propionicimonas sp.]
MSTTTGSGPAVIDPDGADPFGWLEEVEGGDALAWVRERNAESRAVLDADPDFAATEQAILEVLDSDDRIPEVARIGDRYYNFWRDARHARGIWRRTTLESYRSTEPDWELVLDLDALAEVEGESWVWHGASVLRPADPGQPWRRALVNLSPGGSDADVTREFDLVEKRFVPAEEGGFVRGQAKGELAWLDADTVYAFTDFGPGTTTPSGYPRVVKLWRRGTDLAEAPVVYEGTDDDMYIGAGRSHEPGFERDVVSRQIGFYTSQTYLVSEVGTPAQQLTLIDVPLTAEVGFHREWLLVELRDDWQLAGAGYRAGSLLAIGLDTFLAGSRSFTVLFEPTPTSSLAGATWTRHHLVINVLDDVKNRPHVLTPPASGEGAWLRSEFATADPILTVGIGAVDPVESDDIWVVTTGYLTPSTLGLWTLGPDGEVAGLETLKSAPAFFDATGLVAEQRFTTSQDGTRIPYFLVGRPEQLSGADGPSPTLLYGYGGFEVPMLPGYSGGVGRAWLRNGGVYVVANIRGGGEYGPRWHQAALLANRHKAYEDFAAVARDLVERRVTVPAKLGAQGGSNGGLLMGNMLTQYPDLFGAIVCQVPLLDMLRYSHLLAGASWMAEYGDPDDPAQWKFIRTFSPYHLFTADRDYPPVLFTTSAKDDRVHPGHARKLAALMLAGGKDVTYYENIEGGHGGAATNAQAAHMAALAWTFLRQRLG